MAEQQESSDKLRNIMLGALYKMGDPNLQDSLLDAWKLSNFLLITS